MYLLITLLILSVLAGVMTSLYSSFIPFLRSFSGIEDYYSSYYGAVSSIERALLVSKVKEPGFVWSGWWIGSNSVGGETDKVLSGLAKLNDQNNGTLWVITSRSDTIPNNEWWDVNYLLATNDSIDYNAIDHKKMAVIYLEVDNSDIDDYYDNTSDTDYNLWWSSNSVDSSYRTPQKLLEILWGEQWWTYGEINEWNITLDDNTSRTRVILSWETMIAVRQNNVIYVWTKNQDWITDIYPFLEYQFWFPADVSDVYYTIEWEGKVGSYSSKITIKKKSANINSPDKQYFIFPSANQN